MFGMPLWLVKLIAGLLLSSVVVGGGYFAYRQWVAGIQAEQRLEDQNKELKQALEDINDLKQKTDKIEDVQTELLLKVGQQNGAVRDNQQSIKNYLNSQEAIAANRDSSEVLKETLRRLKNAP